MIFLSCIIVSCIGSSNTRTVLQVSVSCREINWEIKHFWDTGELNILYLLFRPASQARITCSSQSEGNSGSLHQLQFKLTGEGSRQVLIMLRFFSQNSSFKAEKFNSSSSCFDGSQKLRPGPSLQVLQAPWNKTSRQCLFGDSAGLPAQFDMFLVVLLDIFCGNALLVKMDLSLEAKKASLKSQQSQFQCFIEFVNFHHCCFLKNNSVAAPLRALTSFMGPFQMVPAVDPCLLSREGMTSATKRSWQWLHWSSGSTG